MTFGEDSVSADIWLDFLLLACYISNVVKEEYMRSV